MVAMWSIVGVLMLGWAIAMPPKPKMKRRPAAAGSAEPSAMNSPAVTVAPSSVVPSDAGGSPAPSGASEERKAKCAKSRARPPSSAVDAEEVLEEAAEEPEAMNGVEADEEVNGQERPSREPQVQVKSEGSSPRSKAKGAQYAPKGTFRDLKAANSMLASLRQQKNGNDPVKAAKASQALDMYQKMDWESKESMVQRSKAKARGSMKWLDEWMESRSKDDATAIGWNENWRSPGQVLKHLGLTLKDFDTREQARAHVDEEVRRNQTTAGTLESHPPKIDESNWLMSRYFWVIDQGKTRKVAPSPPPRPLASLGLGREEDIGGQDRGAGGRGRPPGHLQDGHGQAQRAVEQPRRRQQEGHQRRTARNLPGRARERSGQAGGRGQRSAQGRHACSQGLEGLLQEGRQAAEEPPPTEKELRGQGQGRC